MRSTLRIFAAVFDKACSEELEGELSWFAGLLGQVRDRDVLGSRLAADLAALPSQFVLSTVPAQVESVVSAERETAASALRSAMNGRRYAALVTLLEQWRVEPPYTTGASRRRKTAASYVAAAEKQLRRRLRAAAKPGADDDQFHRARKAGKRLRYAAELAAPVLGTSAAVTIKGAQTWQNRLGELQDSVMAAHLLTRLGTTPNNLPSQDGFAYGLLLAQEWERAEAIRASIRRSIG